MHVQIMNRSLWEVQIAASVDGERSRFPSDNFICVGDEVLQQLVCLKHADDKQDASQKIAAKYFRQKFHKEAFFLFQWDFFFFLLEKKS